MNVDEITAPAEVRTSAPNDEESTQYRVYVDPYPGRKGDDIITTPCGKCSGTGSVSWGVDVDGAVSEVDATGKVVRVRTVPQVCFDCNGVGQHKRKVKNLRAAERRAVNRYNKMLDDQKEYVAARDQIEAEEGARLDAFRAEHPDVAAALDVVGGDFAEALTATVRETGSLTSRQTDAILEAAVERRSRATREWIGSPKETIEFEATIEGYRASETMHGTNYIWTLRTVEGNTVKVWSAAQHLFDLNDQDEQEPVRFTATVKEDGHTEYRGEKQTMVTRIKRAR